MSITTIEFSDGDLEEMYKHLTDEELIESIKDSLGMTARQIGILCGKLHIAVQRGINVDSLLPPVIRRWYKHIAAGQVMAELVSQFLGMPAFIDRFARLPLPDQKRLLTQTIPVVEPGGAVRELSANVWTFEQLRLVVADDHLRTPEEQVILLKQSRSLTLRVPNLPGVEIDRRGGKVNITVPMPLTKQELLELATYLGGK